jgi:hypothetical protein
MASFLLTKDNKFKVGNIITNFKKPTTYFRPAKEWIDKIDTNSATWEVLSIERNGDYKLQRLETLTKSPLLEDGGPIYKKEKTMSKDLIDNYDYRLWDKNDVTAVYNSVIDDVKKENDNQDRQFKKYKTEMTAYFEKHGIVETANQYNITEDEVLDVINNHTSKLAKKAGGRKSKKRKTKRSKKKRRRRSLKQSKKRSKKTKK